MEIRISVVRNHSAELESLQDWLRQEQELSGRVALATSSPREGELGLPAETLVVAVGSGGALSVLAASLKAWLSLPRRSDVRIKVQAADGRTVEISADRVSSARIDSLLRQALGDTMPGE
jgi:hypothetical protein